MHNQSRLKKSIQIIIGIFALLLMMNTSVYADSPIEISSPADLIAIPNGSNKDYVLTCDLDMKGLNWVPKDFCGSLDGQGHSIVNLTVYGHNEKTDLTYDGNMKVYETYGSGLFGHLDGATIRNLNLPGLQMKCYYTYDNSEGSADPSGIFMGSIAGFMTDSVIDNVFVSGQGYLETNAKNFGIGGFAGYGNGQIQNSTCDMVLTCVDTDKAVRDEQFMGGAYAAGCINLVNNRVSIRGFDSDHGYVHNGGLVGMYIHYYDNVPFGHIDGNTVSGIITFFEDNTNRRAYCEAYIGEIMCWNLTMDHNKQDFTRNEVFDYSKVLLPHDCEKPHWSKTIVEASEGSLGYTFYHCDTCGYEYNGNYTLFHAPQPEAAEPLQTEISAEPNKCGTKDPLYYLVGAAGLILILVLAVALGKRKKKQNG